MSIGGNLSVSQFSSNKTITTTNYQLVVAEDLSLNGRVIGSSDASFGGNLWVGGQINSNAGGVSFTANNASYIQYGSTTAYPTNRFNTIAAGDGVNSVLNGDGGKYVAGQGLTLTGQSLSWGSENSYASQIQIDGGRSVLAGVNHGQIRFYTANTQQMTINESGAVGIGTTNPAGKLHIYESTGTGDSGGAASGSLVIEHGNNGGSSSIIFPSRNNYTSDYGYIRYRDDVTNAGGTAERSRLEIGTEDDFGSDFGSGGDALILQKNGGYVGIGTTNPISALDVSGSIRSSGSLTLTGSGPAVVSPNTTAASSSSWTNNGVTWTASASSTVSVNESPYKAFNTVSNTDECWHDTSTGYTAGVANTTFQTTVYTTGSSGATSTYNGEWLQIQSSIALSMKSFNFGARAGLSFRLPAIFYIVGSNTGTGTWTPIFKGDTTSTTGAALSGTVSLSGLAASGTISNFYESTSLTYTTYGNLASSFTYFRLIISKLFTSDNTCNIAEWTIDFNSSSVSLALDSTIFNQLNVGGSVNSIGQYNYIGHNSGPPAGAISAYLGTTDPDGWIICDGVQRTNGADGRYNRLITAGIGSGTANSTYTPPNLKGQFLYGSSTTSSVNGTGGASSVTLTTANLPAHNHTATDSGHTHANTLTDPGHVHATKATDNGGLNDRTTAQSANSFEQVGFDTMPATTGITINNASSTANITIGNTGSGTAFSILPTYTTVNYIIKY